MVDTEVRVRRHCNGIFSNLFKKKESTQSAVNITVTAKTEFVDNDSDIPPLQGDYAKAVFLWAHSKAAPIGHNDSYARYFLYECGIRNPSKYHRDLISEKLSNIRVFASNGGLDNFYFTP